MQQVQEMSADRIIIGFDFESSSVSTSMRLPLWLKWYQYSSIEPSEAISLSAMPRASG